MVRLNKKLSIITLVICVISCIFVKFTYLSLLLSVFSLILCMLFLRKQFRVFLIIVIVSIATIITNCFVLYNKASKINIDVFQGKNLLLGTWNYNLNNSGYVFSDDYSFIQYDDFRNKDNYCSGTYNYSYGGTGKDGKVIYEDNNNYYYDLEIKIDYCFVDKNKIASNKIDYFIFGINKNNYSDLTFIDISNNYAFKVEKF